MIRKKSLEAGRPAKKKKTEEFSISIRLVRDAGFEEEEEEEEEEFCREEYLTPFGSKGDYDGVHNITARINVNGEGAGVINCNLVERDLVCSQFYSACDAESRELQYISVAYFDSNGSPREPEIQDCDPGDGGVLYISEINIDSKFRNTPVRSLALKKLLTETLSEPLGYCPWSIALYICESGVQWTQEERKQNSERWDELYVKDLQDCLRIGFSQAKSKVDGEYEFQVFANYDMLTEPMKSEEELNNIKIHRKTKPSFEVKGKDKLLKDCVQKFVNLPANATKNATLTTITEPTIAALIQAGACIEKAGILHFAVAGRSHELIDVIIKYGGQKYINSLDDVGNTPLMIAANMAPGTASINNPPKTEMIKKLLSLGADVNVKGLPKGLTAYGCMLQGAQGCLDFSTTFGMNRPFFRQYEELEFLLRPWGEIASADLQGIDGKLLNQTRNKKVKIHGFISPSGQTYNNVKGKIILPCDSKGQWGIEIDEPKRKQTLIRSENLKFIMPENQNPQQFNPQQRLGQHGATDECICS